MGTETQTNTDIKQEDLVRALDHIEKKWDELERFTPKDKATLVGLPYPYIVSGSPSESGFAFNEMYYWDSYLTAQGLLASNKLDLAKGMLENLMHLMVRFGIIPNANRFYLTGRSQPPFLSSYIFDIFSRTQDIMWLRSSIQIAQTEYENVWLSSKHPNWRNVFQGLSRYYDINLVHELAEAESGWDTTDRFDHKCLQYLPIDLNCLLYKYETDFAAAHGLFGDEPSAHKWQMKAAQRAKAINELMWDKEKGFFFDYNFIEGKKSPHWTLAAYYSLWCGLASQTQADSLASHIERFLHKGGLVTTLDEEADYLHKHGKIQWTYPNGWAPLHWIAIHGLENYGHQALAEKIAKAWLKTNVNYFLNHGVFREAYNVVEADKLPVAGLYPPQLGFGWTNSTFVDLAKRYL